MLGGMGRRAGGREIMWEGGDNWVSGCVPGLVHMTYSTNVSKSSNFILLAFYLAKVS